MTDTGVGIDKAYQEVIFTKFYQPGDQLNRHSTGKTKFKGGGPGLGLSICRKLVNLMGGKIRVASSYGTGSTFSFTLPM